MTKQELVNEIVDFIEGEYVQECEFIVTLSTLNIGSKKASNSFKSLETLSTKFTSKELTSILETLNSYAWENTEENTEEETEEETENLDQDSIIFESTVEMNELFNEVGLLTNNLELEEDNVLVIETDSKPIHIHFNDGYYHMFIDYKFISLFKFDEIILVLKNLFQEKSIFK